ncbi:MAG: GNAT family protein [Sphingomonadales bacterium]
MSNQISLVQTGADELSWILDLEADARAQGFIRGYDEQTHKKRMNDPQTLYLTIKNGDEAVGFALLSNVNTDDRNVELSRIIIGPRGSGTGQAALREILDYCFKKLNAHKVSLDTFSYNHRAQHIYEKFGFKKEGILRDELFFNGEFHDLFLYGLLAKEWAQSAQSK